MMTKEELMELFKKAAEAKKAKEAEQKEKIRLFMERLRAMAEKARVEAKPKD